MTEVITGKTQTWRRPKGSGSVQGWPQGKSRIRIRIFIRTDPLTGKPRGQLQRIVEVSRGCHPAVGEDGTLDPSRGGVGLVHALMSSGSPHGPVSSGQLAAPSPMTSRTKPRRTRGWRPLRRSASCGGESRFATQGNKFAVHEGSTKIRCHFWHHPTRPMEAEECDQLPDRSWFDPAEESG